MSLNKPHLGFKRVTAANVLETDPIVALLWRLDHSTGAARPQEAADWISIVMGIQIRRAVPHEVQRMFSFVQGAFCYAHWYYPIVTLAMHDTLRIADFATNQACKQRLLPHGEKEPFYRRIETLASVGAMDASDKQLWHKIRERRNHVTHLSSHVIQGFAQAYAEIKHVTDMIDRLHWLEPNLRPATEADRKFVEDVYFSTQRHIIEHLFGWRGDEVERERFADFYDMANTQIALMDGVDIGWLTVQKYPSHVHLQSIYLTEEWQGRGIGGGLIGEVIDEAASASIPVRLSTAKINRAQGLYQNMGFQRLYEDEFKAYFEYRIGEREMNIRLRPVKDTDFELLRMWFSDPEFVVWWGGTPKSAEEVARKYLGGRPGVQSYIIENDGEEVGYVQSWEVTNGEIGIDVVLLPSKQGKGIGVAAVRMFAEQLQDEGYATVSIDPAPLNTNAIDAFQKAGFQHAGTTAEGKLRMIFVR